MADDNLPTIWEADPHTIAKLSILSSYLKAWMPILSSQAAGLGLEEVVYIDAFAGPGQYAEGEPGSPLVAVTTAREHAKEFKTPIRMFFIEKREDRWKHLDELLSPMVSGRVRNVIVERPIYGDGEATVDEQILADRRYARFPALVFLDQFGYSAVSMDLVRRVMSGSSREVFAFMNWRDLNRWLPDPTKWPGIDRAFGGDEWRQVLGVDSGKRSPLFLELYIQALRNRANVIYSTSFSMHDHADQLLYWLIFCTNSDRGLEEMKRAMWRVDSKGHFRFSDRHSGQLDLLPGFDQEWLAEALRSSLEGQEMTVKPIRHYVLTETPCHQFNEALHLLEKREELEIVSAPAGRRKATFLKYLDDPRLKVRFLKSRGGTLF